ncbi:Retrovirus-related Pol poly from transposon [Paramuricea clavata]|uniref:Retrovirus-related Pol poly from transposon n=1 Tax=Paramuricea clavata TaxID=317549 RepID=A0A6S7IX85_PARCT|nr:Retrovirus-related Pol poly from transposon [Paramuricea clavata]
MATIGKIYVFDEIQESWERYVERVQHFFAANDVDDNHQVPTLLSLIGSKTYSLLKDLLLPEKPADKNLDEIVSTLKKHLNPKPLEIAERFRFYKRNQQQGESILSYVAELKKLTTHCNFGSNLEETLRDRLVCGLCNQRIQKRLFAESKLKFSKAVDIAVAMETATRDPQRCVIDVELIPNVATECRFKKEVCHKCGKRSHIQRACRAQQSQGPGRPSPRSRYQKSTLAIETELDEYGHLLNNLEVNNVNKSSRDVIWVDVKVENQPLSMELDTGSAVSILPYDMFLERFRDKELEKTTTVLKTYTGELIVPVGCLTVQVEYIDQSCLLPFHVVQTKGPVLMGRDWLHKLRLNWKTIKFLKSSDRSHRNPDTATQEKLKNLLDTYAEVFEDKLGTFKSAKARITLK